MSAGRGLDSFEGLCAELNWTEWIISGRAGSDLLGGGACTCRRSWGWLPCTRSSFHALKMHAQLLHAAEAVMPGDQLACSWQGSVRAYCRACSDDDA